MKLLRRIPAKHRFTAACVLMASGFLLIGHTGILLYAAEIIALLVIVSVGLYYDRDSAAALLQHALDLAADAETRARIEREKVIHIRSEIFIAALEANRPGDGGPRDVYTELMRLHAVTRDIQHPGDPLARLHAEVTELETEAKE